MTGPSSGRPDTSIHVNVTRKPLKLRKIWMVPLALVALIGVPPTSIFIAKLYIFTAAVNADLTWLAIVGVISSVVSAYYYVRIIRVMFLQPAQSEERISAPAASWAALGLAGASMLFMGLAPGYILELSRIAVGPLTP